MKITRRQFLLQAAAAAITTAAGWAVTGARVEDTPAPAPPELEYYVHDDFSNPNGARATPGPGTRVVVDSGGEPLSRRGWTLNHPLEFGKPWSELEWPDPRAYITFENGAAIWRVPLDERTAAPEWDHLLVTIQHTHAKLEHLADGWEKLGAAFRALGEVSP